MTEEVTPTSIKPKKKKKFGLFRRKKSKNKAEKKIDDKTGEVSQDEGSFDENDSEIYEFSDLEEDESESEDADDGAIVAPGMHYTTPAPTTAKTTLAENGRGRDLTRGTSENLERSRSRSRSRSVSSAFRQLMGGIKAKSTLDIRSTAKEEWLASKQEQRKDHPSSEEVNSLENPAEKSCEMSSPTSKKSSKRKDSGSLQGSLTGIEISLHDDDSAGPVVQGPAAHSPKKKKKSKKKKDKDSLEDDETASRDSLPPLSKKKSTRKKAASTDGSSAGDSFTKTKIKKKKSKREFDVVDRAMKIKQQRASIQEDLKDTVKHREKRTDLMKEFKEHASSSRGKDWENEEFLLSPKPDKSSRSMLSAQSSRRRSIGKLSSEMDGSLLVKNDNAVLSLSETVAALSKQVETQRKDNSKLQKSLAEALLKITKLNEDLREQEVGNAKSKSELLEVKKEMASVKEQNEKLHKSLDEVEMELSTKDDHLDSLEQVVEEQVEKVQFLEKKLEETEDELFQMEVELKKAQTMAQSAEDASLKDHADKVNSIRAGRMQRMASKKNLARGDSVRDLINGSLDKSTHNRKASDLASRERKLEERERQLQVGRERDQTREERLKEWEEQLVERERQLRTGLNPVQVDVLNSRERDLEERERLLKANLEKLEQEHQKSSSLPSSSYLVPASDDEKDELIKNLREECQDLLAEKIELIRKYEEEERQREEDLQVIQEDIDEKLRKLDDENEEFRQRLEEADERAMKADDLQKTVARLETEIAILKKTSSGGGSQGDMLRELQEEVTQQLNALDAENRKLSDLLAEKQKIFQKKLDQKDEAILELEEMLKELEKARASDAKDKTESLSRDLEEALRVLREKQTEIEILQRKLGVITEEFEQRNAQELLSKNAIIRQLEDELIATRAVIEAKTSDQLSMDMKAEIKSLKENLRGLNKRMKHEQYRAKSKIKELENALSGAEREASRLKKELERMEQRKQIRATSKNESSDEDLKQHLEDLEDEVDHWKKANIELEDELAHWKSEAQELKSKLEEEEDQELEDDISVGSLSFTSQISRQSRQASRRGSLSSLSREDMFFVSNKGAPDSVVDADANSSLRAMRTVTDLWSKMTLKQPSAPTGLYQMSLDD